MTTLTLTNAGLAAMKNAQNTGINSITITEIAVSDQLGGGDAAEYTSLTNEVDRTAFSGQSGTGPGNFGGSGLFEGAGVWNALEVGIFAETANGTEILLAVARSAPASTPEPLLLKNANIGSRYSAGFTIVGDLAAAITFQVTAPVNLNVPLATRILQGIGRFATAAEGAARSAVLAAVTPDQLSPVDRFATDAEIAGFAADGGAVRPDQQLRWRSINTRAPTAADGAALPVGHLWVWGVNEWTLESRTIGGIVSWKQTRGTISIYSSSSAASSKNSNIALPSISQFSFLEFHARANDTVAAREYASPISITTKSFIAGSPINLVDEPSRNITINYATDRSINYFQDSSVFYLREIFGIY